MSTIAVIGHGRSPEGRGWGKRIDECTVYRMWDWQWQPCEDYGKRYDYGLFVLTPRGLQIFNKYNKRTPTEGWLAYMGKPTTGELPNGAPVQMVNLTPWTETAQSMGGAGLSGKLTLTRGCAAAAWAITQAGIRGEVILVGFDNVRCGVNRPIEESFCPAYWKQYIDRFKPDVTKTYPIGSAKTATHDMGVELPFLEWLAGRYMVKLSFAEDVWKVIRRRSHARR